MDYFVHRVKVVAVKWKFIASDLRVENLVIKCVF